MITSPSWTFIATLLCSSESDGYFIGNIVEKKGNYVDGKMNGIWYFYNEKGELIKKERYDHGFLQQSATFENGKVVEKENRTRTKFDDSFYEAK